MARVGQGKQSFRIIYFFLCRTCRERLAAHAAYREGLVGAGDPAVRFLESDLPQKSKKPKIVAEVLKILCSSCESFTIKSLVNLEVIGKKITVPDFKGLLGLEQLLQHLYGGIAYRMGVPTEKIAAQIQTTFFPNALDEGPESIWQRMVNKLPEMEDLLHLKFDFTKKTANSPGWLAAMSGVLNPVPADLHDYMSTRGWAAVRRNIKPYGKTLKDLQKNPKNRS